MTNDDDNVLVVASNRSSQHDLPGAWELYRDISAAMNGRISAYICQPARDLTIQVVGRIAFYSSGRIEPLVPAVIDRLDDEEMVSSHKNPDLRKIIVHLIKQRVLRNGQRNRVFLLSPPEPAFSAPKARCSIKLRKPIPNVKMDKNGDRSPFTYGKRYVSLAALLTANDSDDLE
ncbi:MAG: hypothetical protein HY290_27455 [Planctomycetia bacterium]|nr:hypothetical protein [Planctomycetia bacterium]